MQASFRLSFVRKQISKSLIDMIYLIDILYVKIVS